jgi:hypothetical protein
MATYDQIQEWVKQQYGFTPKDCWIAHIKHKCGIPMREAHNRRGEDRVYPCPPDKEDAILSALRHFGMIK